MKRPWTVQILLPLVMLILLAVSCDRILRNLRSNPEEGTVPTATDNSPTDNSPTDVETTTDNNSGTDSPGAALVDSETGIQITLPASWAEDTSLHDSAELQAADATNQLFVIVVAEDSPVLMRFGLPENAARYRALIKDQLATSTSENPTEVAFIDDNFASQYEIRGSLADGTGVVYLHTTVVTEQRYYQIVAWASPEQYETYRSELQTITETFEEIGS
ncbi:PsbP-related protein [Leptolyngbya iicbica]|uniref:PsbP C-terminal domain-containing protein n=2 Tax=Cyanophyceae TaxID=3028117 RepID=A0A4Q7EG91_9CYAN|nr:hypothetical protein [Leptolyngbya sp. LK]RZM82293.1 hypothetical protein DYY88_03325 [Leptolyngbya sp. LK]